VVLLQPKPLPVHIELLWGYQENWHSLDAVFSRAPVMFLTAAAVLIVQVVVGLSVFADSA
jgi:hypothetical protein